MRVRAALLVLALAAFAFPATAQHTTVGPAPATPTGPFDVMVHGHYQNMMRHNDLTAKAGLAELPAAADGYALGALANRQGEITVVEGKQFVSLGTSAGGAIEARVPADAQATLLVTGKASQWTEIAVPHAMSQSDFEAFVVAEAAKAGISPHAPFPFLVRGAITDYVWHVLAANQQDFVAEGKIAKGELVGFYSARALAGIATHPGEFFHVHYLNEGRSHGGHVDRYGVAAGSTLSLPKQAR